MAGWVPRLLAIVEWFWQARRDRAASAGRQPDDTELASADPDELHRQEIAGQPLPNKQRTDDRYELLIKFQGLLKTLGYGGIIVLVDRVDEPHLINGSVEQMRALLWPMLDNKFLKHPGIGLKLLLPTS